uniref:uncharacterized protein LOC124060694 n=1 Tax=Scatophagus argus TaxID=75038 RepID=UPI001ED801AB|nr:uncharacterized protein LOC124060694 [Scatophagus argus]
MWKVKKTRTVNPEKYDADASEMIVGNLKKSIPRMRTVRSKNSKCLITTTYETSGNKMRLCVNLMPVLAAAKEPVEEQEEKEEDNSWTSKRKPETGSKNDPPVTESTEQILDSSDSYTGLNLETDMQQAQSPQFVLPPISQRKPAPGCCDHRKTKGCPTPLPPISLPEQTRTVSSNFTTTGHGDNWLVTGQDADTRPWIDNPLFSRSRSPEFHLPDISMSSLSALLQTISQKLERKSRGGHEGPWRRAQSDHLLAAGGEQRLRGKSFALQSDCCTHDCCTHDRNLAIEAEPSAGGHSVRGQMSLPPPQTTLILTMTKKNLLPPNMLQ